MLTIPRNTRSQSFEIRAHDRAKRAGSASYDAKTVVVDADTLDEALEKAIAEANEGDGWEVLDDCGVTFIDAVAEGDGVDLWCDEIVQLPVPARFTEKGEGPRVIVILASGAVQAVAIEGGYARVEVRDYDTEGADPNDPDIRTDGEGRRYAVSDWSNTFPPPAG